MCLAIVSFRERSDWPLFVASNRDEFYDRPSSPPSVTRRGPRTILAPEDRRAGGTWIGINDRTVFAVITNRSDLELTPPPGARSRGLLVGEILASEDRVGAREMFEARRGEPTAPYNLIFGDRAGLFLAVANGESEPRLQELGPGVHYISNHGEPNDGEIGEITRARRLWGSRPAGSDPWSWARRLLSRDRPEDGLPPLSKDFSHRGTVSSTILGLSAEGRIRLDFADGPPQRTSYETHELEVE